jgi:murein tripeptide amidase MpaA
MPLTGYLTAAGIESCLTYLATTYPAICQLITLPEHSIEGRVSRAVKIANGAGPNRPGILVISGVHAREVVNPDMLVGFGLKLCQAYTANTALAFGGKTYDASLVKLIVDQSDIILFPLVNPDGRVFVQASTGDSMWRKNRNPNPGLPGKGVDINRNYDILWSSGIGTSAVSTSDIYKGSAAFSEPETRNARSLLDTYPNVRMMVDVHSYSELVLYPWGDDNNQTTDPGMNFQNSAYNGLRGVLGDSLYREYIPGNDATWYATYSARIRDAIAAVRGRVYTAEQSPDLYPTSGTSDDYSFSRHFVDAAKRRVRGITIETGQEFQPAFPEASHVMDEGAAGVMEACVINYCNNTDDTVRVAVLRAFRHQELLNSAAGRRTLELFQAHGAELIDLLAEDDDLRDRATKIVRRVGDVLHTRHAAAPRVFDDGLVREADELLHQLAERGSTALKHAAEEVRRGLGYFHGQSPLKGLEAVDQALAQAATSSS